MSRRGAKGCFGGASDGALFRFVGVLKIGSMTADTVISVLGFSGWKVAVVSFGVQWYCKRVRVGWLFVWVDVTDSRLGMQAACLPLASAL